MSEAKDKEKKTLSLGGKGTLSLKGGSLPSSSSPPGGGQSITQSGGRGAPSRTVAVEVRRRRTTTHAGEGAEAGAHPEDEQLQHLTPEEREVRMKVLREAEESGKRDYEPPAGAPVGFTPVTRGREEAPAPGGKSLREKELEELQKIEEAESVARRPGEEKKPAGAAAPAGRRNLSTEDEEEEESYRKRMKRQAEKQPRRPSTEEENRRLRRLTVTQVLNQDYERDRGPSLAAQRRAREKARMAAADEQQEQQK